MLEIYDQQIAFVMPYWNIPVNWTIVSTWIVMLVLAIVSWLATRHLKTGNTVSHWQTAMEVIVKGIYGQINEVTKSNAMTYLPSANGTRYFPFSDALSPAMKRSPEQA